MQLSSNETLNLQAGELKLLFIRLLRLTAYYAQQRVLCVTRTRVLKAVDKDQEIGNNRQQVEDKD